ncbi:MAG: glycosyltransferase family 2 protein [Blastochloris sp.]|nr:glycosyltransferase family 2 protein [Blastochloris sp.]
MKFIGVACVKNESDVIEAFVRHNLVYLNKLILLDHGSTDATPAILQSLQQEGLPLEVIRDDSLGKLQGPKMTRLMQQAARDGADWILLLDGDEFILTDSPSLPLPAPNSPSLLKVGWTT